VHLKTLDSVVLSVIEKDWVYNLLQNRLIGSYKFLAGRKSYTLALI